jgi:acyl-CoA synthetase (AMP-forming)/AMP-acid ligase II
MTAAELLETDFSTMGELVRAHAAERPEAPALYAEDEVLTYAGLDALMDRVAAALERDGVHPGDAVAVCALSSIAYAALFLGALRAGVVVTPLAPSSTPDQLVMMLEDCAARLFFLDAGVNEALAPRLGDVGTRRVALDGSSAGEAFEAWLAPPGSRAGEVRISPDDPFNIIYSSGTTGSPKGIVQSHGMRWLHVNRAGTSAYGPEAVAMISTPLYSNTTLVSFFPTIGAGGAAVLMKKFDARRFLEEAERRRATHAMLVPVQYRRLMDHPDFDSFDLSAFRLKFSTSAPFAADLKAEVLRRWPGGLVEYYGMTEGGGSFVLAAHEHPDKLHTVGRPIPGHEIRLIDEDGREVAVGEIGEVVGSSAAMMKGYHNQPEKTKAAEWTDASGRRYIRTGDVGRFDADGFLTLMDRRKDMIISGGFNIYPSDLEAVALAHPAVAEAAVVGAPSRDWGETPVAFVALKGGATADPAEIKSFVNAKVGKTQRLADVRLVEALPRSAIGKVLKRELRDAYRPAGT